MKVFRDLTSEQEAAFRQWARANYNGGAPAAYWHPVVRDEWDKIEAEGHEPQAHHLRHARGYLAYARNDGTRRHKPVAAFTERGVWHCVCGYPVVLS